MFEANLATKLNLDRKKNGSANTTSRKGNFNMNRHASPLSSMPSGLDTHMTRGDRERVSLP